MPVPAHGPTSGAPAGAATAAPAPDAAKSGYAKRATITLWVVVAMEVLYLCCGGGLSFAFDYAGVFFASLAVGSWLGLGTGLTWLFDYQARQQGDNSVRRTAIITTIVCGVGVITLFILLAVATGKVASIG